MAGHGGARGILSRAQGVHRGKSDNHDSGEVPNRARFLHDAHPHFARSITGFLKKIGNAHHNRDGLDYQDDYGENVGRCADAAGDGDCGS